MRPEQAEQFLAVLPVTKFFGVGKVTAAKLEAQGIHTGADLRHLSEDSLHALLGKYGDQLYHLVRGEDHRAVEPERLRKSIGKETTLLHDISDREEMMRILEQLASQVETRLHEMQVAGKTVTLKVKFADFEQITRAITLTKPLQDAQAMMPVLRTLLAHLEGNPKLVRLLGVTISGLVDKNETTQSPALQAVSLWE